jgi:hypothetical protein
MSSGYWERASESNRGGPPLYAFFWIWLLAALGYLGFSTRSFLLRRV